MIFPSEPIGDILSIGSDDSSKKTERRVQSDRPDLVIKIESVIDIRRRFSITYH